MSPNAADLTRAFEMIETYYAEVLHQDGTLPRGVHPFDLRLWIEAHYPDQRRAGRSHDEAVAWMLAQIALTLPWTGPDRAAQNGYGE